MAIESELRTEGLIASCIAAGQAAGVFRPVDPVMTASLIKPLLQDWYLKRWKYQPAGHQPGHLRGMGRGLCRGFLAAAAGMRRHGRAASRDGETVQGQSLTVEV